MNLLAVQDESVFFISSKKRNNGAMRLAFEIPRRQSEVGMSVF
jgi:hypothetical protein